jgi:hypothetical protein
MKIYRKVLRYWIAIASALSFLGGWIILAHSPKPVQPDTTQSAALPTLAPLPAFDGLNSTSNGSQAVPQINTGMPLLRTRGS